MAAAFCVIMHVIVFYTTPPFIISINRTLTEYNYHLVLSFSRCLPTFSLSLLIMFKNQVSCLYNSLKKVLQWKGSARYKHEPINTVQFLSSFTVLGHHCYYVPAKTMAYGHRAALWMDPVVESMMTLMTTMMVMRTYCFAVWRRARSGPTLW